MFHVVSAVLRECFNVRFTPQRETGQTQFPNIILHQKAFAAFSMHFQDGAVWMSTPKLAAATLVPFQQQQATLRQHRALS